MTTVSDVLPHMLRLNVEQSHILLVDDNQEALSLLEGILSKEGYDITTAPDARSALELMRYRRPDLIVSDINMPRMDGMAFLAELRAQHVDAPVILMTAFGSLKTAVDGINAGAFDYVSKPFVVDEVRLVTRRALEHRLLLRRHDEPKEPPMLDCRLDDLVGSSPAMVHVYKAIARIARRDTTVLLQGESGTGKELVARAIHDNSLRNGGPFVTVDGTALAETLLESELFGHERGAFTGAMARKKGLLEQAHGGTCFVDEVADLSPALQGKLLRMMQNHEIRRVGGTATMTIDIRIIAASKKRLDTLVQAGTFREDLFYRMNVVSIDIPPLRERPGDIPLLADFFIRQFGASKDHPVEAVSTDAMELLQRYSWPGNVRELEHAIESAVALTPHTIICPEDLPDCVKNRPVQTVAQTQGWMTLAHMEREHIVRVLESHDRDIGRASLVLGIHRKTLLRKLRHYGMAAQFGLA
jgi:DNA-binding NtrC family response regulator